MQECRRCPELNVRKQTTGEGRSYTHEIEYLSLSDEVVKTIHYFLNTGRVVPPVDIEDVDIIGPKFFQRSFDGYMHGFGAIAVKVGLLQDIGCASFEVGCVLCHIVAVS